MIPEESRIFDLGTKSFLKSWFNSRLGTLLVSSRLPIFLVSASQQCGLWLLEAPPQEPKALLTISYSPSVDSQHKHFRSLRTFARQKHRCNMDCCRKGFPKISLAPDLSSRQFLQVRSSKENCASLEVHKSYDWSDCYHRCRHSSGIV